jgi:serine/threonine protein kinase
MSDRFGVDLRLSVRSVAMIAVQLIRVLQITHDCGFIHSDIKPENILLGVPGTAEEHRSYLVRSLSHTSYSVCSAVLCAHV